MIIVIYTAICLTISFIMTLFGFFVGRCARKLPILDEHMPRAFYRGQLPPWVPPSTGESPAHAARRPEDD